LNPRAVEPTAKGHSNALLNRLNPRAVEPTPTFSIELEWMTLNKEALANHPTA